MDDLVKEFLVESYENLDRLDRDFVELEKNPSREVLGSIFRAVHTIKGTCGFLGYSKLESITHLGENLLGVLRDGRLQVSLPITDALLGMVDAVREMLASIEANGDEGKREDSALIKRLTALQKGIDPEAVPAKPGAIEGVEPASPLEDWRFGAIANDGVDCVLKAQAKGDPRHVGKNSRNPGSDVLQTLQAQGEECNSAAISDSSIRVDVGLLNKLINLVGELVRVRNQILQFTSTHKDAAFTATSQRLDLITTELQENVMKMRMQPIGTLWSKLPRVVRDLANACGKQVRLEMEGKDTKLDKTLIEAIKDPLTHMVRNSVDHGVETPNVRVAAGKPTEGVLFLKAYQTGGQVIMEISDDGAGLNSQWLKDKALQKGLISSVHAARMGESEMNNLIFMPGFSTAEKVTNVSGRGVGMDVVKTNIEKIGGTVDVQSKKGHGMMLRVKIPCTLAIIPSSSVTTSADRYAIP